MDSEKKKVVCKTLRFVAHHHAASLVVSVVMHYTHTHTHIHRYNIYILLLLILAYKKLNGPHLAHGP